MLAEGVEALAMNAALHISVGQVRMTKAALAQRDPLTHGVRRSAAAGGAGRDRDQSGPRPHLGEREIRV